jgi:hypothetical protein
MGNASSVMTLRFLAGLALCVMISLAQAQSGSVEDRLKSSDPAVARAAAEEIVRNPGADPLLLMAAAHALFRSERKDDAVFWFYAGQLRARYTPQLKGENSQLITIFVMTGEGINAHAQRNIAAMDKTVARVLKWDDETFPAWVKANRLDLKELAADRSKAREGLVGMMAKLKSDREHYEKLAREYKDPMEQYREQQAQLAKRIEKNYSTRTLERVVAGKTFRLPANYFLRGGLDAPAREEFAHLTVFIFLPQFEGFARDTPLEFGGIRALMYVRINDSNERKNTVEVFDAFIATNPPRATVFGAEAYVFDGRSKARLPLSGYMSEHVFRHELPKAGPVYMSCKASVTGMIDPNPRCVLFMRHAASGLRYNATFSQDYANDWVGIATRLNDLFDSWYAP